jgi:hypothetical protein
MDLPDPKGQDADQKAAHGPSVDRDRQGAWVGRWMLVHVYHRGQWWEMNV